MTMVRKYQRKVGSRKYKDEPKENIEKALQEVAKGKSIRKASKMYNVAYGTLWNKHNKKHLGNPGHPTALSKSEELKIKHTIDSLTSWREPMSKTDIKLLVKVYLDKKGMLIESFKENYPGDDWMALFIKRHGLTQRFAQNVKPSRTKVNADVINNFFDNWEIEAKNVPKENICNFDETNVTNQPGTKKVICRKGIKQVERKVEHSKASVSLMYSGFADGTMLPPMVIYKSNNIYENWCVGGPPGTVYDCTTSEWFDIRTFEAWFFKLYLPEATKKQGKKIFVGDNLSSHFSYEVVKACEENNIAFVPLLPNATHLIQPLDVCFFAPAKRHWRKILSQWRKESRSKGPIPK